MSAERYRFDPRVQRLAGAAGALPLSEALARLDGAVRAPALFEGGLGVEPRASVLAFDPLPARAPARLSELSSCAARLARAGGDDVPGPFQGGFCGALAYELGAELEPELALPCDPWALPRVIGGLYTDFLVRDELRGETWLVLGEEPGDARPSVAERRRAVLARLAEPRAPEPCRPRGPLERLVPAAEHAARVTRARELIAAGEIYQANLSVRFQRDVGGDPLDLYRRLVALHPAPCAGFLRFAEGALLSASPELLLEFTPGQRARTRPIKGTAARALDPLADRRSAERLLASEKDRSELAMIVDLERNDLGRIARPGSVRVEAFPRLESYATVHHLVADVSALPRAEVDAGACLAALFPGGSITGAPKLRSMEIIAALEGEGRGFAYGSLLWLDTRGALRASLLIRTLLWRARLDAPSAGQVTYRVGGGITWGSEPAAEEAEVEAKGRRLAEALEGARELAGPARAG